MNRIAVIQAGGKGTRLRELTGDVIPKPLLALNGKPMIQWQIECMKRYGIESFVIITGYLGEKIEEYFGDGSKLGVSISYIRESADSPLGSAGALYYLKEKVTDEDEILLIFGDVMFDINVDRMLAFHEEKKAFATLLIHPNSHPFDSDLVMVDDESRVIGFDSKNNVRDYWYDNLVNAGIYVLAGSILNYIQTTEPTKDSAETNQVSPLKTDLEKDILFKLVDTGRLYGYRTCEYVKDAGTVDRFTRVRDDQKAGVWEARNLSNPQKCIFLDRDGTVNKFNGLVSTEDGLELEDVAAEAIARFNNSGYLTIVITNQPVVARGMCDIADVQNIHKKLAVLLGEKGAYLDDIAFCPHHPDKGYPEENPIYKIKCNCRKPATGMIDDMVKRYNIDLSQSYMIGDSTIDIQTGKNAGLKTILVQTGVNGSDKKYDAKADYEVANLMEASDVVLGVQGE